MTLRLTIDAHRWHAHIDSVRSAITELIPVVKGNGYGIGRTTLANRSAEFAPMIAVGTVHELAGLDIPTTDVLVLTPAVHFSDVALAANVVPTVAAAAHVNALAEHGWSGRVAVKLASSMHRYGVEPDGLGDLERRVANAGFQVHGMVLHTPLNGGTRSEHDSVSEIEAWLATTDPSIPLSVSHLSAATFSAIAERHGRRRLALRSGTALWHGDKTFLHLQADVIDVVSVAGGEHAGYRSVPVETPSTIVMVGAGSAHGIGENAGGLSPFHHARRRIALVEPPHMHTSMLHLPAREPAPAIGDWVDVQRPLILVAPDEVVWR